MPPARVLDVGSGIGETPPPLPIWAAVEPTHEVLAVAQNLYGSSVEWITVQVVECVQWFITD